MNLQELLWTDSVAMNAVLLFITVVMLLVIIKLHKFLPNPGSFYMAYWVEKGYTWDKSDLAKLISCINPSCKYTVKEMDYWIHFMCALNAPDSDIDFYIAGFIYCTLQESGSISVIPDSIQHSIIFIDGIKNIKEKMETFENDVNSQKAPGLTSKALAEQKSTIRSILVDAGITTYKHIYGGEK